MKNRKRLFLISALLLGGTALGACGTNSSCAVSSQSTPEYTLISADDIKTNAPALANGQRAVVGSDWHVYSFGVYFKGFGAFIEFPNLDHTLVHDVYVTFTLYDKNRSFISRGTTPASWDYLKDPTATDGPWVDVAFFDPGFIKLTETDACNIQVAGIVDN
ncbi:MAG: hypothetical protein BWY98_01100 [Tenericutes bacterium ADurb.BinA155]|nr:MAG: hypothetical protein BWY98_01100 [Tenericutes bacterium ADurb.BinA155]